MTITTQTATLFTVRSQNGETRKLPASTLLFPIPDDLQPGEPVQVELDLSAPEYPAGALIFNSAQGTLERREQVAASRLGQESTLPRSLWLVPEPAPRDAFYYVGTVKPDVLGAAGAELETDAHRYSAVVNGKSFTLTVTRFDAAGRAVEPVRYTGTAAIDRDALVLDIGDQAAAVPSNVLTFLHDALEKRLGLQPDNEVAPAEEPAQVPAA